jgi:hypothetical protein
MRTFRVYMTDSQNQLPSSSKEEKHSHFPEDGHAPQPQTSLGSQQDKPQQTDSMEVHKHPHHVMHSKKWPEYLLEFFMLFLAVFLGFVAENIRENIKANNEIHEDMQSIVADLNYDIAYFDSLITRNEYSCRMADSTIRLLNGNRSNTSDIYFVARAVTANFGYFFSNAKTFEQMKTSGLLRHIPKDLLDSIANYYTSVQFLTNQADLVRMKVSGIHEGNSQLFNGAVFENMMQVDYGNFQRGIIAIKKPAGNPPLLTTDPAKINDVTIRYHYFFSTVKFYDKTGLQMSKEAAGLIGLIKKEYRLQ